jgi:outer membrane lipoprotein SlyB
LLDDWQEVVLIVLEPKSLLISWTLLLLVGCAADPIVDQRGVDPEQYALDMTECQGYADQVDTGKEVAKQAGMTGLVGGVLAGAFEHGRGVRGVEEGVGAGATIGAARGVGKATSKKERVMNQCMRARGYIVYD